MAYKCECGCCDIEDAHKWIKYFTDLNGGSTPTDEQMLPLLAYNHRCTHKLGRRPFPLNLPDDREQCCNGATGWIIDLMSGVGPVCKEHGTGNEPIVKPYDMEPDFWENM